MCLLVIFILIVLTDQIPDEVMPFFLHFFNQHGKVFVEFDDFLVCCDDALKLTVVELFMVTVTDYQDWQDCLGKGFTLILGDEEILLNWRKLDNGLDLDMFFYLFN
jgi:hypothetical protein